MSTEVQYLKKESSGKYDKFLQLLVNNRVRIMHIKRNLNQKILDKEELILYAIKTYILYRIIIFNILDIDKSKYQERLTKCIAFWNRWNDNLMKFM